jgi:hypothetical protein
MLRHYQDAIARLMSPGVSKIFGQQVGQVGKPALVRSVAQPAAWERRPTPLLTSR